MPKPWSVSTTVRNPDRLLEMLKVLDDLDGHEWNHDLQNRFQILLIKNRLYGYGQSQFYNGLTEEMVARINDKSQPLSYKFSSEVFQRKNYEDPPMRGRQSLNPLKKLGFVVIRDEKVSITELGKSLIAGEVDVGDAFLKSFLKWQLPNPSSNDFRESDGFNVAPFVATLHLIDLVNKMELARGGKAKGLSKREFALFVPTLTSYQNIESQAKLVIDLRDLQKGLDVESRKQARDQFRKNFAHDFLGVNDENKAAKLLENLQDYGDNTLRYFRLTRWFHIRGNGYYIDLEPKRLIEIRSILEINDGRTQAFATKNDYLDYISDINLPELPWETREAQTEIAIQIENDVAQLACAAGKKVPETRDFSTVSDDELAEIIEDLRKERTSLQLAIAYIEAQDKDRLQDCIDNLKNIYSGEDRPIRLERNVTFGLNALNDAIKIKPNYPVGDDSEPTSTAPGGVPDIECFYESFNAICEVTMLKARDQWYNEGQPVMRHLRDFEDRNSHDGLESYCLFIAPKIHRDTLNTFWMAAKFEYEGSPQKIIPITIDQFVGILEALHRVKSDGGSISHVDIQRLLDSSIGLVQTVDNSSDWLEKIDGIITAWEISMLGATYAN